MASAPEMTIKCVFTCQVCVPHEYTDDQVRAFANKEYPSGVTGGWIIHDSGPDPTRVQCEERADCYHIMLKVF